MEKIPLAIIFNDVHLQPGNELEIIDSVKHLIKYAEEEAIGDVILAGDLFESRSFQRQSVLLAFDKIINMFMDAGIQLHLFPGNHDKTTYKSFDSFLDIYRYHPGVKFNRELKNIKINDVTITLLPFYSDEMIVPMIKEAEGADILISHFEMNGSTHLGKVSENKAINRTMLRKWKKTYLGHYHNTHEITKNIVHLPSLRQANFGEDNNKGFSVIYDDLSYKIIRGKFKEFKKISIDINKTNNKDLLELIKLHSGNENTVRFEFTGEKSKLDALDKNLFNGSGIDIKKKYEAIYEINENEKPELIKKYDKEQVHSSFKQFCDDKDYDYETGIIFLNNFLKENND